LQPERPAPNNLTQILESWRAGNPEALNQLTPLVYNELHHLAEHFLAHERRNHILAPTALVNEAFLRLLEWQPDSWKNRTHFYGVSAQLMRRVLVHYARRQKAEKRGGQALQVTLSESDQPNPTSRTADLEALDQALTELEGLDPRQSKIVELRYFAGLTLEEAAHHLNVSVTTVRREWQIARAWLHQRLT
jgi:RNA polymerase sigma factor (TIGR02999 family)